ncbi:MAG: globin family protein [Halopseudomonas aestusnigri]
MNKTQIDNVQRTFKQVAAIKEQAAELFYGRLFELDPSLKKMFRSDMKSQGKKLMVALATVVAGLKNLDRIVPVVQSLGVKHVGYGVREKDYDTVGSALIWTLEKGLGADFTPAVRDSWLAAYTLLAGVMKEAAADVPIKDEFKVLMAQAFVFIQQKQH